MNPHFAGYSRPPHLRPLTTPSLRLFGIPHKLGVWDASEILIALGHLIFVQQRHHLYDSLRNSTQTRRPGSCSKHEVTNICSPRRGSSTSWLRGRARKTRNIDGLGWNLGGLHFLEILSQYIASLYLYIFSSYVLRSETAYVLNWNKHMCLCSGLTVCMLHHCKHVRYIQIDVEA